MATLSVRPPARPRGLVRAPSRRAGVLLLALVGLLFVCLLSLAVGSRPIGLGRSLDGLTHYDASNPDHVIVHDVRVPRTLIGLMVGSALGLAGALMQGVTRNPLADPGLLNVTAGAATAIAVAVLVIGVGPLAGYVWFAFAGAALGVVVVVRARRADADQARVQAGSLTLAGLPRSRRGARCPRSRPGSSSSGRRSRRGTIRSTRRRLSCSPPGCANARAGRAVAARATARRLGARARREHERGTHDELASAGGAYAAPWAAWTRSRSRSQT